MWGVYGSISNSSTYSYTLAYIYIYIYIWYVCEEDCYYICLYSCIDLGCCNRVPQGRSKRDNHQIRNKHYPLLSIVSNSPYVFFLIPYTIIHWMNCVSGWFRTDWLCKYPGEPMINSMGTFNKPQPNKAKKSLCSAYFMEYIARQSQRWHRVYIIMFISFRMTTAIASSCVYINRHLHRWNFDMLHIQFT